MLNEIIETPIGEGIEQGKWAVFDGAGAVVAVHRVVRFTLDDEVAKHMQDANCVTPRATNSALFHFPLSERGAGWSWVELFLAVVFLIIVIMFGDALGWPW